MANNKKLIWVYWFVITLGIAIYLSLVMTQEEDKRVFLPGETSSGHHQIEMACASCHLDPFGGKEVLQEACINCHGAELEKVHDSHPIAKFRDPRNADRLDKLDALSCTTCHTEHKEEITLKMGVTLPGDFCIQCHAQIGDERESHQGLDFMSCGTAGCHNYHDNEALYEDFLVKHAGEPMLKEQPQVVQRNFKSFWEMVSENPVEPLAMNQQDAPMTLTVDPKVNKDWHETAHANAGVNCTQCHQVAYEDNPDAIWQSKPSYKVCMTCHEAESEGFLLGKHGMRLAQDLSPMTPAMARLPMKSDAAHQELTCLSCHGAHRFDSKRAAVQACLNCHDDDHSNAYKTSPHFELWHLELAGKKPQGSGVSCATCHLPRVTVRDQGKDRVVVEHNQNMNLRPNEKMIRSVCMNCHGLEFSIDALADESLIKQNFSGMPSEHIPSVDWATQRE